MARFEKACSYGWSSRVKLGHTKAGVSQLLAVIYKDTNKNTYIHMCTQSSVFKLLSCLLSWQQSGLWIMHLHAASWGVSVKYNEVEPHDTSLTQHAGQQQVISLVSRNKAALLDQAEPQRQQRPTMSLSLTIWVSVYRQSFLPVRKTTSVAILPKRRGMVGNIFGDRNYVMAYGGMSHSS